MSRQSISSSSRPPAPAPPTEDGEDGPPPVPKPRTGTGPRGAGAGRRANLPVWPPPGHGTSQQSSSPTLSKVSSRVGGGGGGDQQQRGPAPLPPTASHASSGAHSRSPPPHPPPPHSQPPNLPPPRAVLPTPSPGPSSCSSPPPHHRSAPVATLLASSSMSGGSGGGKSSFAFGTCLQEAHDAINKRHEEELHALESFRAHVFFRAKADREYAQELAKINSRANKTLSSVSQSSAIVQAWKSYIEMCVSIQKMISDGAVLMSGAIVPAIDQLYKDKKGAKKVYDTDRARMQREYDTSTKSVHDLKRDYERLLKTTETQKRKLEGTSDQKAEEKYRRKFVAQANLLHNGHNNYVLSILNANSHQEHWRSSLLPFCLDTLQQRMELQITEWKEALSQYAQATDLTQTYQDSFTQFYEALNMVDKEEEYVKFIQDNRQEQRGVDVFKFHEPLGGHYCSPQVEPGTVVLNNLTNSAIKTKLEALERELQQHEKDIAEKEQELQRMLGEPEPADMPMSPGGSVHLPKHVRMAQLQGEAKELNSFVARKTGQAQVIRQTADTLGDSPPPIFDPLGEGVDVRDLDTSVQAGGATGSGSGSKSMGGKMGATLFRGVKGIKGLGRKKKKGGGKKDADSLSTGGYPKVDFDGVETASVVAQDESDDAESLYDEPPEVPVEEEPWYYGDIDRKLAESKCRQPGDYLVRYSARATKYVLTCNNKGTAKHFMIQTISGEDGTSKYRFEGKAYTRIAELLKEHVENKIPVTKQSGTILIAPIVKTGKWSLRHSDVQVGKKIGKGAFGEVFEATLKTGERVAVKTCRSNDLTDKDKFLQEAEILQQYVHPNIVRLIGVCAERDPVYIVMELMPGGALLEFLRKKGSQQGQRKLCTMAIDACKGMDYLEQNNCIHRDLAARNCLVSEGDSVKIGDFGMSREDEGGIYIVQSGTRNIPIKWTAPEGLNFGKYTSASDVWSYGILLWEVFSCGSAPYPGMNNQEARNQVEVGYRMGPPADCPSDIHAVMTQCWQYEPEERPNFAQILEMLNNSLAQLR